MNKNAKSYLLPGVLVTLNTGKEATILTGGIVNNEIRTSAGQVSINDITGVEHYTVDQVSKMPELKPGVSFRHNITGYVETVTDVCKRPVSEHLTIETNRGDNKVFTRLEHICYIMNCCHSGILSVIPG